MNDVNYDSYIVLSDVRSVHNVGSIFRTADCLGVPCVILVGVTPAPLDRFGRARSDFAKVSLGAEKTVAWMHFPKMADVFSFLNKKGVYKVAFEIASQSVDYREVKIKNPVAFIFGNEVEGLSQSVLKKCDVVAEIPMKGKKESLNISITVGIGISRLLQ